jgi:hypothetical protein
VRDTLVGGICLRQLQSARSCVAHAATHAHMSSHLCVCQILRRVRLHPGRTCEMHKHTQDTFYTALTDGPCKAETAEGKSFDQDIRQHSMWWNMNRTDGPMVHKASDVGLVGVTTVQFCNFADLCVTMCWRVFDLTRLMR